MIFVTTGSLFPFDRLIAAMDAMAAEFRDEPFFAQIGDSQVTPRHMEFARLLARPDFVAKARAAKVIVAHAGMGSVLSALEFRRPIVLLPRRLELGEHNTDHQMATARWLTTRPGVNVCFEESELAPRIKAILAEPGAAAAALDAPPADFIGRLRDYISG